MDFYENFLCQIIGIIVVNNHLSHMPVHSLLIGANEQVEPIVTGLRISDLFQQFSIFQGSGAMLL
jgi:hypothetical protein